MQIIRSRLFLNFPELIFGLSTKSGPVNNSQYGFNLSLTVGDDPQTVLNNRELFYNELGLTTGKIATQKQIHSDIITFVEKSGLVGESDAMVTSAKGIGLAVSTADCVTVFIYDSVKKVIAGIHSGWRGTEKKIVRKTLALINEKFGSKPENLFVFVGPSISQKNYEVGKEVAGKFDERYSKCLDGKICLDVMQANVDMLMDCGIPGDQIEISPLCSYAEKDLLHSYRRDGEFSGRSLGVLAIKEY